MRIFKCDVCASSIFFENTHCLSCGSFLGFDPAEMVMRSFALEGEVLLKQVDQQQFRYCQNQTLGLCNWVVPEASPDEYCVACSYNNQVPVINDENMKLWQKIEVAKHRLIYSLLRWNIKAPVRELDPEFGLAFDFVENMEGQKFFTGHAAGLITLNIAEADDSIRAKNREQLNEPYRTLLGHLRHEVGHYYWDIFFQEAEAREQFREVFGDESLDYQAALAEHYKQGEIDERWQEHYISHYATSHPWEDWAETWAHYIHIVDTLESAYAASGQYLSVLNNNVQFSQFNPYHDPNFDSIINGWLPLTYAVNSINRSMGVADLYPFVLTDGVLKKMRFVHDCLAKYEVSGLVLPETLGRDIEPATDN